MAAKKELVEKEEVVEEVVEQPVVEEVVEEALIKVEVISSFYDLTANETLRNVGDVLEVDNERANKLIKLGLVKLV